MTKIYPTRSLTATKYKSQSALIKIKSVFLLFSFCCFISTTALAQYANVNVAAYLKNSASFETDNTQEYGQNEWTMRLTFQLNTEGSTFHGNVGVTNYRYANVDKAGGCNLDNDDILSYDESGGNFGSNNGGSNTAPQLTTFNQCDLTYATLYGRGNLQDSLETDYNNSNAQTLNQTMDAWEDDNDPAIGNDCSVSDIGCYIGAQLGICGNTNPIVQALFGWICGSNCNWNPACPGIDQSGLCQDIAGFSIGGPHPGCGDYPGGLGDRGSYWGKDVNGNYPSGSNNIADWVDLCQINLNPFSGGPLGLEIVAWDDALYSLSDPFNFRQYAPPGYPIDNIMGNNDYMGTIHSEWNYTGTASPLPSTLYCSDSVPLTFPTSASGDIFSYSVPLEAGRTYWFTSDNSYTTEGTYMRLYGTVRTTASATFSAGATSITISSIPAGITLTSGMLLNAGSGHFAQGTKIASGYVAGSLTIPLTTPIPSGYSLPSGTSIFIGEGSTIFAQSDVDPNNGSQKAALLYTIPAGQTGTFYLELSGDASVQLYHTYTTPYTYARLASGVHDPTVGSTIDISHPTSLKRGLLYNGGVITTADLSPAPTATIATSPAASSDGIVHACASGNVILTLTSNASSSVLDKYQYSWGTAGGSGTWSDGLPDGHSIPSDSVSSDTHQWAATLDPSNNVPSYLYIKAHVTGGNCEYWTSVTEVQIDTPAIAGVLADSLASNPVCAGGYIAYTSTGGGSSTQWLEYEWTYDNPTDPNGTPTWDTLPGAGTGAVASGVPVRWTSSLFSPPYTSGGSNDYFFYVRGAYLSGGGCPVRFSNVVYNKINYQPDSVLITYPGGSACVSSTVTFTATAYGIALPRTWNYQWLKNGVPISGATSSTYAYTVAAGTPATVSDSISCVMTITSLGFCFSPVVDTSNIIAIPIGGQYAAPTALPTAQLNPAYDTVCTGLVLNMAAPVLETHANAYATSTSATTSSTSVTLTADPTSTSTWTGYTGALVFGTGIPAGTYVANYSSHVLTLSTAASIPAGTAITITSNFGPNPATCGYMQMQSSTDDGNTWSAVTISPTNSGTYSVNPPVYPGIGQNRNMIRARWISCSGTCPYSDWGVVASWVIAAPPTISRAGATFTPTDNDVCGGTSLSELTAPTISGGSGTCTLVYDTAFVSGTGGFWTNSLPYSFLARSVSGTTITNSIYATFSCPGTGTCGSTSPTLLNSWIVHPQPDPITSLTKDPNVAAVCEGASLSLSATTYGTNRGYNCPIEYQYNDAGDADVSGSSNWGLGGTTSYPPTFTSNYGTGNHYNGIRARLNCDGSPTSGCNSTGWTTVTWLVNDTAGPITAIGTQTPGVSPNVCIGTVLQNTATDPDGSCSIEYGYSVNGSNFTNIGATNYFSAVNSGSTSALDSLWARRTACTSTNCPAGSWQNIGAWTVTTMPPGAISSNAIDKGTLACGTTITDNSITTSSTNCYGDDNSHVGTDVYYKFLMSYPGTVFISTCGSNFNTYLTLLDALGNTLATASDTVRINSGSCSTANNAELLTTITEDDIANGNVFYAVVDGETATDLGNISLSIQVVKPNDPTYESGTAQTISAPATICPTTPTTFSIVDGANPYFRSGYEWTFSPTGPTFTDATTTSFTGVTSSAAVAGNTSISLTAAPSVTPHIGDLISGTGIIEGSMVTGFSGTTVNVSSTAISSSGVPSGTTLTFTAPDSNTVSVLWNSTTSGTATVTPTTYGGSCPGYALASKTVASAVADVVLASPTNCNATYTFSATSTLPTPDGINYSNQNYWQGTDSTVFSTTHQLPYTYTLPSTPATNTYYIRQYNSIDGCYGNAVAITISGKPATPTINTYANSDPTHYPGTDCPGPGGAYSLTATNGDATSGIYWQSTSTFSGTSTNGTASGGSYTYLGTAGTTSDATNYFAAYAGTCWSGTVSKTISKLPPSPTLSVSSTCSLPTTLTCTTADPANNTSYWQNSDPLGNSTTGGTASGTTTTSIPWIGPLITGGSGGTGTGTCTFSSGTSSVITSYNAGGTTFGAAGIRYMVFSSVPTAGTATRITCITCANAAFNSYLTNNTVTLSAVTAITGGYSIGITEPSSSGFPFTISKNDKLLFTTSGTTTYSAVSKSITTASLNEVREQNNTTGCWGDAASKPVSATVGTPVIAASGSPPYCGSATIAVTSPSLGTNETDYWQGPTNTSSSTSTPGSSYSVTSTGTNTYYFRRENTVSGCWSAASNGVSVNVIPPVSQPNVSVSGSPPYCGSATIVADAAGTGETNYWQNTTSGGTSVGTATSSQTVTTSDTYYYRRYNSGCWGSESSHAVTVSPGVVTVSAVSGSCMTHDITNNINYEYVLASATGGTSYTFTTPTVPAGYSALTPISIAGTNNVLFKVPNPPSPSPAYTFMATDVSGCNGTSGSFAYVTPDKPTDIKYSTNDNTGYTQLSSCYSPGIGSTSDADHWLTFRDPSNPGEALLSINDNGNDLGLVTVYLYKDGSEPVINETGSCTGTMKALRRHFKIVVDNQPGLGKTVGVRLFLTPAEITDLSSVTGPVTGDPCADADIVTGIADLYVTKYHDGAAGKTNQVTTAGATSIVLTGDPIPAPVAGATISGPGIASNSTVTSYNSGSHTVTVGSGVVAYDIASNTTLNFSNTEDNDYSNNDGTAGYYKVYGSNAPNTLTAASGGFNTLFGGSTGEHYLELNASDLSEFWIHGSFSGSALPVNMLFLEANAINNTYIQVTWATATEINNHGFNVERSVDGVNWTTLGFVQGHNNSSTRQNYSYSDLNVVPAVRYYYRLKQIDNDNNFEYTSVVTAIINGAITFEVKDFVPNPASNTTTLRIITPADHKITVDFYDVLGQKVYSGNKYVTKGENRIDFDLTPYAAGTYTAVVTSDNNVYAKKLIVAPY